MFFANHGVSQNKTKNFFGKYRHRSSVSRKSLFGEAAKTNPNLFLENSTKKTFFASN
jgi:hypothetical protein